MRAKVGIEEALKTNLDWVRTTKRTVLLPNRHVRTEPYFVIMDLDTTQTHTGRIPPIVGALIVTFLTVGFGITATALLFSKWVNFDPFLFDFAIGSRIYQKLLHGVPFNYSTHYYTILYMGVYPLFLPLYVFMPSVFLLFAIHVLCFTLAIPLLYTIARNILPGILLPLVIIFAYTLNPSIDIMVLSFLRLEALWMVLFFLTILLEQRRRRQAAVLCATAASIVRIDAAPAIFLLGLVYVLRRRRFFGFQLMKRALIVIALMLSAMLILYVVTGVKFDPQQLHFSGMSTAQEWKLRTFSWPFSI